MQQDSQNRSFQIRHQLRCRDIFLWIDSYAFAPIHAEATNLGDIEDDLRSVNQILRGISCAMGKSNGNRAGYNFDVGALACVRRYGGCAR